MTTESAAQVKEPKIEDRPEYQALLKKFGKAGAREIVKLLDEDEAARFQMNYRRYFNEGQLQGAMIKGQAEQTGQGADGSVGDSQIFLNGLLVIYNDWLRRRSSTAHLNAIVNGHLINFWAMAVNLFAFFTTHSPLPFAGATLAVLAYVSAWIAEGYSGRLPKIGNACYVACVLSTAGSWACALIWALQFLR